MVSRVTIGDPRKGGFMKFDMQDGKFEELEIFEHTPLSVLEFDWFGDVVRFELYPEQNGCLLIFIEKFNNNNRTKSKRSCRVACLSRCHKVIA